MHDLIFLPQQLSTRSQRKNPPPPPSRNDSFVSASQLPPDSQRIICSRYWQAQHDEATALAASMVREEQPTFIMVHENVSDRRRRIELGQEPIFKRDCDLQLYVVTLHLPSIAPWGSRLPTSRTKRIIQQQSLRKIRRRRLPVTTPSPPCRPCPLPSPQDSPKICSSKTSWLPGSPCALQCALPKQAACLMLQKRATRMGMRERMRGRRGVLRASPLSLNELPPPENRSRTGPARAKNAFFIYDFMN